MGFWKGKRVLITGISGFVGPYLAQALPELSIQEENPLRPMSPYAVSGGLFVPFGWKTLDGQINLDPHRRFPVG